MPALRVSAASPPASPASTQRPCRAAEKQATVSSRNSDSLYTAWKKNDVDANDRRITVHAAVGPSKSSRTRRYSIRSAAAKQATEMTTPAAVILPVPSAPARTSSGYSGKKAWRAHRSHGRRCA